MRLLHRLLEVIRVLLSDRELHKLSNDPAFKALPWKQINSLEEHFKDWV